LGPVIVRSLRTALAGAAFAIFVSVSPARAAEPVFGQPTIDATFSGGVTIEQPVTLDVRPFRVELLLRYADAPGPLVIEVPSPDAGPQTLRYTASGDDGHILPNTPVEARWRITEQAGAEPVVGPSATDVVDDDRFAWDTVSGDVIRVHWYEGGAAFGQRALEIGEEAVAETSALLGVTEDEPIDFFIYADQDAFRDALGPDTRENVGGQANADIRTLFALIPASDINDPWVATVVPHELVHLVFDTAVSNPYHFPPRWLNEGLAVYLSQGYDASDRGAVEAAASRGTLIPLEGLEGQFPTSAQQFFLAYAESVSAVDFFIRTHDQDALVELISSYADGRTDDEAFEAAIGMDAAAFDAAWLADLGADTPVRHGPQPAPPGPEPAAWAGTGGPEATSPPNAGATADPTSDAGAFPAGPVGPGDGSGASRTILLAALLAVVGVGIVALVLVRRSQERAHEAAREPEVLP
jgi:hypothetical protein